MMKNCFYKIFYLNWMGFFKCQVLYYNSWRHLLSCLDVIKLIFFLLAVVPMAAVVLVALHTPQAVVPMAAVVLVALHTPQAVVLMAAGALVSRHTPQAVVLMAVVVLHTPLGKNKCLKIISDKFKG